MCGCTAAPPFWSNITLNFVCVPFTTGFGVGCSITLRLLPVVALFIVPADVMTYIHDGGKILKMQAIITSVSIHLSALNSRLNIFPHVK
jgi:hypothetical protein